MNKMLVGMLVLIAGVVAGWYFLQGGNPAEEGAAKNIGTQQTETTAPGATGGAMEESAIGTGSGQQLEKGGVAARTVVTYTDTGFSPNPTTVTVGTTVTFVNESSRGMWVASAVHPTHQLLPGFDQLKAAANGGTYEYTFTKAGTWKYHNHVNPTDTGTVVVTQ